MEEFRDRVKVLMKEKNLTAKDIGEMTEIGYRTVEGWLGSKKVIPRADSAVKLAKALNVTVEYLVTGKDQVEDISDRRRVFKQWVSEMPEEELESLDKLINAIRWHVDNYRKK